MFVELIDQLRCPRVHEESWLVASSERTEGRDIVEGILGCPVCRAEYRIANGIVRFGERVATAPLLPPDEEEALRLAAVLDLTDPRGYVVLVGALAAHARLIQRLTDVHLLLVDPPPGIVIGGGLSGLTTAGPPLPLAHGSARGVALDRHAADDLVASALAVLQHGGRLVAPATLAVPAGVTELARDSRLWVGARQEAAAVSAPIGLQRR